MYGTTFGKGVDAESKLAVEMHQLFVFQAMNMKQEFKVPDCFTGFKGEKQKNCVTNETDSYSIGFGDKSVNDEATLEIFKEFAIKCT